jgi:hypothetical protein
VEAKRPAAIIVPRLELLGRVATRPADQPIIPQIALHDWYRADWPTAATKAGTLCVPDRAAQKSG